MRRHLLESSSNGDLVERPKQSHSMRVREGLNVRTIMYALNNAYQFVLPFFAYTTLKFNVLTY